MIYDDFTIEISKLSGIKGRNRKERLNILKDQFFSAASLSFLSLFPSFLWLFHSCLSDL
jgi:hypothetical protein